MLCFSQRLPPPNVMKAVKTFYFINELTGESCSKKSDGFATRLIYSVVSPFQTQLKEVEIRAEEEKKKCIRHLR